MTSIRALTTVAAAAVVAATLATATTEGQITLSASCQSDCSSCSSTVNSAYTSGTRVCAAGFRDSPATSVKCVSAAGTCFTYAFNGGTTDCSSSGNAKVTATAVCNVCAKTGTYDADTSTWTYTSAMTACTLGSSDVTTSDYSTGNCTGNATSTLSYSASCLATRGDSLEVTSAAYGCNVYDTITHEGTDCSSGDRFSTRAAQNECIGSGNSKVQVSCHGNDAVATTTTTEAATTTTTAAATSSVTDTTAAAESASAAISAAAAVLAAILCVVA